MTILLPRENGGLMSGSWASGPEWILAIEAEIAGPENDELERLAECARRVWPKLSSFGRRALGAETSADEKDWLISEVFEQVLMAAAKSLRNSPKPILDLEAYLAAAFRHELARRGKQAKRLRYLVQYVAPDQLDVLHEGHPQHHSLTIDDRLQVEQVVREMDGWTREVWVALTYGLSWQEIGDSFGMDKEQAKQKFRYSLKKIRTRLGRG